MSYPTGMGAVTGNHYNNVAAQMDRYLRGGSGGGGGGLNMAHGSMHQHQSHPMAYASNGYHSGGHSFLHPAIQQDIGGFARKFARNLLH